MGDETLSVKVDVSDAVEGVRGVRKRIANPTVPFKRIHREMVVRVTSLFDRLRKGGRFRGITWKYFAPQGRRKDGTVVPAWGGVPRVAKGRHHIGSNIASRAAIYRAHTRITGTVKGRKRPSGRRIKKGDAIMQDTGNLKRHAMTSRRLTRRRLYMGPNVDYAEELSEHHPFALFHVPSDADMIEGKFRAYFAGSRRGRRRG